MKKISIMFAAIFLFATTAFAQIEGRVTDAKGNGVANVEIKATGADGAVASTATTDEDGKYAFEDLDAGIYKITAKGPAAFQPAVRENVNVLENETTTLDITLAAAVQSPAPPAAKPAATAEPEACRTLYVGNLAYATSEEIIRDAFSAFGEVTNVQLAMDKETGRPRGFGFVVMGSSAEAARAIKGMDGQVVVNRQISVKRAENKEKVVCPNTDPGGGGGSSRRPSGHL